MEAERLRIIKELHRSGSLTEHSPEEGGSVWRGPRRRRWRRFACRHELAQPKWPSYLCTSGSSVFLCRRQTGGQWKKRLTVGRPACWCKYLVSALEVVHSVPFCRFQTAAELKAQCSRFNSTLSSGTMQTKKEQIKPTDTPVAMISGWTVYRLAGQTDYKNTAIISAISKYYSAVTWVHTCWIKAVLSGLKVTRAC